MCRQIWREGRKKKEKHGRMRKRNVEWDEDTSKEV